MGDDTWAGLADLFADEAYASVKGRVRTYVLHQHLLEHLPEPPATVLDVGGGPGYFAAAFATHGLSYIGVEPDPREMHAAVMNWPMVQTGQRGVQFAAGHPDRRWPDPIQRFAVGQGRFSASIGDRVDDRSHRGQGGLHVHSAAGQRRPQPGDGQVSTPQVDARHNSHANHCPRAEQLHIRPVV